nr:immunoglobulin heavy chain junction region [Mus musculus]MBK4185390.1 immunoglobulin heavy chain junction region [Mus musculus]MBK4185391.1 immunoglobulin heavy chain junction region [Mus musculus]MBK4185393.1 immunoglobulin heavy chain junction region [Mus musculus]MBK4185395.1 immunoglobulin heavy chain junction region [Mus musculus]
CAKGVHYYGSSYGFDYW